MRRRTPRAKDGQGRQAAGQAPPTKPAAAADKPGRRGGAPDPRVRSRRRSAPSSNGCWSAARSSTPGRARSSCAKTCSRRPRRTSRPSSPRSRRRKPAPTATQGRSRGGPLQGPRHHVRDDEAEGRRQDLRPARHQGAGRGGEPDQSAPHVRNHGADVARGGREADRRVRLAQRYDKAQKPADLPKIDGKPTGG